MSNVQQRAAGLPLSETGFPEGFVWGAATSAYQIEGATDEDGRGESIWDRFCHTPGTIVDGSTGDVACDHYLRWQDDLNLIQRLGLKAYRFSIAWPRMLPEGYGRVNAAGLDFYERLVDGLLARGVQPFATLYHWDLPQVLEDRGGWRNRDTARFFADFAYLMARRLGDRVGHWITHNEPWIVTYFGHVTGEMAPGLHDRALIGPVAHHLLLSHGLAVQAIRSVVSPTTQVGITLSVTHIEPVSDREEDVQAAHLSDTFSHRLFLDPLYRGKYPDEVAPLLSEELVRPGDLDAISAPIDFLGLNYYTRTLVRARGGDPLDPETVPPKQPKGSLTTMGFEVYPEGLYMLLHRIQDEYAPRKLYITENGAAYPDTLTKRGEVHDTKRITYLREHMLAARAALAEGVRLQGYFVWSLMDNFEWAKGYTQRFGIVYVDFPTQRRIVKASGQFVSRVAATNGGYLQEVVTGSE
ncbi:MAG: GH1 family beta-glucosidase [Ktedonobacterales bacterium]